MLNVRSLSLGVKRLLLERVKAQTLAYEAKTFGMSLEETNEVDVGEPKCL